MRAITTVVNKLHERETAAAIRKNIASCLAKIGVLEKQIYRSKTNSGSSVLVVGELMRSDLALLENFADQNEEDECEVSEAFNCKL